MTIVLLDGEKIKSKDDVHKAFAQKLSFPEYYGNNLDALHDVLTETDFELGIIVVNTTKLSNNLEKWLRKLITMFEETERESKKVHLSIEPFDV